MKKIIIFLHLIVIFPTNSIFSQFYVEDKRLYKKKYNQARKLMEEGKYLEALPIWFDLNAMLKYNHNTNFQIGLCYYNIKNQRNFAIPYFEFATKNISLNYKDKYKEMRAPILSLYYLAKLYHMNLRIEEALKTFLILESYTTKHDTAIMKDIKRHVEMCYTAKRLMKNPLSLHIYNLGNNINTQYAEYCPVITLDGKKIFYTSKRPSPTKSDSLDENIYYSEIDEYGNWQKSKLLEGKVNTPQHEAILSISPDGKKILIYKEDGNIYESNFIDNQWSEPIKLNENINSPYLETHAMLSEDGKLLFFTSNRPNGYGGLDIWVSSLDNTNNWSIPANLGPTINTPYDEETPYFIQKTGKLYFSSQGHESMGGFDIFYSILDSNNQWSKPKNVGYPINSTDDDIFYLPIKDGEEAYYASVRQGGFGEEDIYHYKIVKQKSREVNISGIVFDSFTTRPLKSEIFVFDDQTNEQLAQITTTDITGEFALSINDNIPLRFEVKSEGYHDYFKKINIEELKSKDNLNIEFVMNKIIKDTAIANMRNTLTKTNTIVLNNIYFDSGKSIIKKESYPELEKVVNLMKIEPTLKIEISGHTDNIGSAEKNKRLSLQRAQAVVNYLKSKGIDEKRMTYAGYGFDKPIADNNTEEGRSKNRRIEFKVVSK